MSTVAESTRWLDATAQAELVREGELSRRELVEAAIERIEAFDGAINAVVMRWFDHALALADERAAGSDHAGDRAEQPFGGVPFLLKDLWAHYAGQALTNGNAALRAAQPVSTADTTLVARFRAAGLIALGRTNSPELGSVPVTEPIAYGPTRNPWNLNRVPGGSSGGAAAAVAAGMVPLAHASDGGGSIRIPAACCGLVGLKPSQGRITLGPLRSESALSVELAVTRSVRDTARLLDAVHGPGVGDSVIAPAPRRSYLSEVGADPGRLRVGLLDHHPRGLDIDPACAEAARDAVRSLEALGHHVESAFPASLADGSITARFMSVWAAMMATGIAAMGDALGRPLTEDEVEPDNWWQAEQARHASAVDYAEGQASMAAFRRATQQWWADGWDLLVTPTLGQLPLRVGELSPPGGDVREALRRAGRFVPFTPAFNITGQPAISLPLCTTADGVPIGVQLVAGYGREDVLIQVASQLEAAEPWADRRPPEAGA